VDSGRAAWSDGRVRRLCLLLAPIALLVAAGPAHAGVTIFEDSGGSVAAIRPTVDGFRADLGALNAAGGRREISWDDVPDNLSEPKDLPPDFYKTRGVVLSTPSGSLQVSANEFSSYNPLYPNLFRTFSPQRLFSPVSNTITLASLFVAGSSTPALSRGFGAVFTNVDTAGKSKIELFDASGQLLVARSVPAASGNQTLSFLGISFTEGRVASVRITSGDHPIGSKSTANDVTVLDDFIYGEPAQDGADADGVSLNDNCPDVANTDQGNVDGDAEGDACDRDADDDGVPNVEDAFPLDRKEWLDTDGDGIGDNADTDDDNDGLSDTREARIGSDPKRADTDGDGVLDPQDNCPRSQNADQLDSNRNGRGDVCDDMVAPRLARMRLRPKAFRAGSKDGTLVSYRLSEGADVRLGVKVARRGHWFTVHGRIDRAGTPGNNFVKFGGRIGGHTLRPGRYRLIARATDDAHNAGNTVRATFWVVR
jgi:hypothetical protein